LPREKNKHKLNYNNQLSIVMAKSVNDHRKIIL